jgi:Kef-type K+ transport system membrane component KefB
MEVDLHDLFELGPQALMAAVGGFVLPFGLGYGVGEFIGASLEESLFIGIAMAATSLATKSRILVDLDLLDTRIAGCCWAARCCPTSGSWSSSPASSASSRRAT